MNEVQQTNVSGLNQTTPASSPGQSRARQTLKIVLPDFQIYSKPGSFNFAEQSRMDSLLQREERQIQISQVFAWIILLINVVSAAMVPCWLMSDLAYQPLTRSSWRFFVISILTLPFVAFQKRKIAEFGGNIWDLVTIDLLRINFICSINFCIWFLIIIYAVNYTSLTHACTLICLRYFISSLLKFYNNEECHAFETAGVILVIIAIICMLSDSITGEIAYGKENQLYLSFSNISRVYGDLLALLGSVVDFLFDRKYQVPTSPRFLNLFLYNMFISFNFISFGYYFAGSELSFNSYYGVFGIVNQQNFVSIFYAGIMLGLNLMLTNIFLNQIFSSYVIKIADSFMILITAVFFHLFNLEPTHPGFTSLSFGFFVPGLILILSGQNALQNINMSIIDYVIYRPTVDEHLKRSMYYELSEIKKVESSPNKCSIPENFEIFQQKAR